MTGKTKIKAFLKTLRNNFAGSFRLGDTKSHEVLPQPEGHKPFWTNLAGIAYENRSQSVAKLTLKEMVVLKRDPTNPSDKNAILVQRQNGKELGFIAAGKAAKLAPYMDSGHNPMPALVTAIEEAPGSSNLGATIMFYLPEDLCSQIDMHAQELDYYLDFGREGALYLLVNCDESTLNQLTEKFNQGGLSWLRSGASYQRAANGEQYRWYIRFEDGITADEVKRFMKETIGICTIHDSVESQFAEKFDEENIFLKSEVLRLKSIIKDWEDRFYALQKQFNETRKSEKVEPSAKLADPHKPDRRKDEISNIMETLLPNFHFLRDSMDVIARELHSYQPVLKILHALSANPSKVKAERVEGAEGWLKNNFSTGQKVDGRFYFKPQKDKYLVLVSFKGTQNRDIDYLQSY